MVWQNLLICILPIIGWLGLLGTESSIFSAVALVSHSPPLAGSIGLNIAIATASSHKGDVFAVQTGQWITAVYALSLATNVSTTSASSGRLSCAWLVPDPRSARGAPSPSLQCCSRSRSGTSRASPRSTARATSSRPSSASSSRAARCTRSRSPPRSSRSSSSPTACTSSSIW